jgi:osomolarity two-component system phosphorelay intermediate protein YPD1
MTAKEPETKSTPAAELPQPGEWNPALTEDFLDATIFQQLLDMDDDDEREFSKGIVWNYFDQVKGSFSPIEEGMYNPPLILANLCQREKGFQ